MHSIKNVSLSKSKAPSATQVLADYEYWLRRKYGVTGTYLVNAKCFLRTYNPNRSVGVQLIDYMNQRGPSLRSILNRFYVFLENREFEYLINDLNESYLPLSNPYINTFLVSIQDRLSSQKSMTTYGRVLSGYFASIKDDLSRLNKKTASKYILSPKLSDHSKRLYKSILKSFCEWALNYQILDDTNLLHEQKVIKRALAQISTRSLIEVVAIKVVLPKTLTSTYHKNSLTDNQRKKLLQLAKEAKDRAVLSLMAWNGLRTIEVLQLNVHDVNLTEGKLSVRGAGKSNKSKAIIKLSSIAKHEILNYLKSAGIHSGKLFQDLTRTALDSLVNSYLRRLRVKGKFSPYSLRHTVGQLMHEENIPLDMIQKTLRHADLRTTMIYSQKTIDNDYFARLKNF